MPFVIADKLWDYSNLPKVLFIQNGVVLLAVVFFWTRKFKDIAVSRTLIAYMVFLAWAGLSIFWATNKYEALVIFSHWTTCGMFLFLVQNLNINRTVMFLILISTACLVSLIGLAQVFFGFDWVVQSEGAGPGATFANGNLAGNYILLVMPLCAAFMVSVCLHLKGKQRLYYLGTLCIAMEIMLSYLYSIYSRIVVIVILILGTYYLVKYLRRIHYTVIAFVAIGLLVAGYFYVNPPSSFYDKFRVKMWKNTGEIIKERPITGVGAGNFKIHYDKYAKVQINVNEAHNDYLQIFCELGIVGLYLAFLVVAYAYRGAFKKCDLYSTALKAGLWAFLIIAVVQFPMQKAAIPFISALYLGMLKV